MLPGLLGCASALAGPGTEGSARQLTAWPYRSRAYEENAEDT